LDKRKASRERREGRADGRLSDQQWSGRLLVGWLASGEDKDTPAAWTQSKRMSKREAEAGTVPVTKVRVDASPTPPERVEERRS